ncbi:DUF3344 domain-containing protein [Methanoculleus sp. 10]|jgi:hypothetical protein|uniref:DUF3344 domain-containing protein n=1 Tax=Methanoculleus sp. 10 TaxID=430615 RepID=UPI001B4A60F6|nr:DUF3344 domain-containing protein [Methanoculleus sp. 10]MBP7410896.1 DUF3344 domain-containing protein [Methanoculleus sp.]
MSSRRIAVGLILLFLGLLAAPAAATYAGDRPLSTVFNDEFRGGYVYTVGNSTYSGSIGPEGEYTVAFDPELPADATVRYQRIYVYWAWSKLDQNAIYPVLSLTRTDTGEHLAEAGRYTDSKGFVSQNDFFSGMDIFTTGDLNPGKNSFTVVLKNNATDNRTFVVQGIGLLAVYESPGSPEAIAWVSEGADLLYSSHGITPVMASSRIDFPGTIDRSGLKSAELFIVAPSGGYTREKIPVINRLFFNREGTSSMPSFFETILSALFPGSSGKEWVNVFDSDETMQVGIDRRDVLPYLRSDGNFAQVQDEKDYLVLTNAVLWAERRG